MSFRPRDTIAKLAVALTVLGLGLAVLVSIGGLLFVGLFIAAVTVGGNSWSNK